MPEAPSPSLAPVLHLTGTRLSEYFRFACDRQLRYELVPPALRGGDVPRPGWDEERGVRVGPRPGAGLLAAEGRQWERRKVRALLRRMGPERVRLDGWTPAGDPRRMPAEAVLELLRDPGRAEVLVQPELRLADPAAFARRWGLDPERVEFGPAVPDLIRLRRLRGGRALLQVVDIKASARAQAAHYAQVAFYSLVLEEVCAAAGLPYRVDVRWGRIWARDGRGPRRFPLAAYRHHVEEILRRDLPRVAAAEPAACAWHLAARCAGCAYLEHCRAEADGRDDLARVVGITPLAKRVLHERGIRSVEQLTQSLRRDTYRGCHALESQAERLRQRAQAVRYGKVFDVETRTHLMPPAEDVRVILSAEGDPVSGRCFALGLKVVADGPLEVSPALGIWVAEAGTAAAERAILDGLLGALERVAASTDGANRARGGRGWASLHLYVYDRVEFELLRDLLVRHLADPGARPSIARLLRFLSPRAVAAQPEVARSTPGTLVSEVVSALFAVPVPYAYDLAAVSDRLRPAAREWVYRPRSDYAWPFSSQVAYERIHNVWRRRPHGEGDAAQAPDAVLEEIRKTVASKLSAIDSVVRAVRERSARRERLQLRKEPFVLGGDEPPLAHPALEALRVFTELESAAEAVGTRAVHVLPATERARRHECIRGMHLVERREDGALVFEFDPECRDAKFRPGDFNLLLTNDDDRSLLEADRQPWKRRGLQVELLGYDLSGEVPRVAVAPGSGFGRAEEEGWIHLDRVCVLDRAGQDFNTPRLLATLRALAEGRGEAAAVLELLEGRAPRGWSPAFGPADRAAPEVLAPASARLGRPVLNADQEAAWRAAFERCVSLVWGPPGTGKTYLLAWMLIGLAAAARRQGKACRILVTAATHRATVNVLERLAGELAGAGIEVPVRMIKLRGSGSEADAELAGTAVEVVPDTRLPSLLREAERDGVPLVVGSTVWSLWKQMRAASRAGPLAAEDDGEGADAPVQPWFDVVVIDEASQMKVPEALVALSGMRPGAHLVLCGDDRQLAPVLRGRYDPEAGSLYGSVFGHFAERFPRLPLRESRRMNRALVEYPRALFYPGLVSMVPERRVGWGSAEGLSDEDRLLLEAFLDPELAVVLCTYRGPRATARNPWEAALVARLARLARAVLVDADGAPFSDARFADEVLAVLAPHRAQNSAILAELRARGFPADALPVVDTVERMQGNERDLILVSYGVADREFAEAEADFLLDPNRFNVAITRARAKLVVLASEEMLEAVPTDERVLAGSMAIKGYRAHCRDGARQIELPGPDGLPVRLTLRYRRL